MKDLGVIFDSKLKFTKHIHEEVNIAYQNLGIIKWEQFLEKARPLKFGRAKNI